MEVIRDLGGGGAVERLAIEDRAQWLEWRQANINASEIGILFGQSPYGSLAQLYAEKKGIRPPTVDTGLLRRGRWFEAAIFEALREQRPEWTIVRAHIYLRDPQLKFGASPDGFSLCPDREGRGIVETKCISRTVFCRRWLIDPQSSIEHGDAVVPEDYRLQVLSQMILAECQWATLAAFVISEFDCILRLFDIGRDAIAEAAILDAVAIFWRDHLDVGIMPQFEPTLDSELLQELYPEDFGTTIDLSFDNRALAATDEWEAVKKIAADVDKTEKALRTELKGKLGTNSYGILRDGRCLQLKREPRRGHVAEPTAPRILRILKRAPEREVAND